MAGPRPSWFRQLFGFEETSFKATRKRFKLEKDVLVAPGRKRFLVGKFEHPNVAEIQKRLKVRSASSKKDVLKWKAPKGLTFENVAGDVGELHRDPANAGAVFQVASQFNCLEMVSPSVRPEDGITIYEDDRTQGPVCAMSCPAASVYRNYLVKGTGQADGKQLDLLCGVAKLVDNNKFGYWKMENGYCLPQSDGSLAPLAARLKKSAKLLAGVRDNLCVGVHWSTSVEGAKHEVCQVFCSGLPLEYAPETPMQDWLPFAEAVLDGAYEATLGVAAILAKKADKRIVVYLTMLGGGVFGNAPEWIAGALERSLKIYSHAPLDVRLVHYKALPAGGPYIDIETRLRDNVLKRPASDDSSSNTTSRKRSKLAPGTRRK